VAPRRHLYPAMAASGLGVIECFFKKNDFHCWVVTEANRDINLSPPISNQHHNLNYHHQLSSTRAYHLQFQTSITNLNYHHQLSSTRVRTGGDIWGLPTRW